MEKTEIEEGNKLIAEFMGYDNSKMEQLNFYYQKKLTWNEVMPVVEKIEKIGFQFFIHNEGSYMRKWHYKGNFPDFGNVGETKIEATYKTVIDFIKWYNQSHK